MHRIWWTFPIAALLAAPAALADSRDDYNRRATERFVAMFDMADADGNDVVTRREAMGTVELEARFDDIDVSRDGSLSADELARFVESEFG